MTFGFFAPLPLPVMIPFMGYQSLVMGEAFGLSYQYAKRRISAMTNEEFNKFTVRDLQQMLKDDISSAIPDMKAAMDDMLTLQTKMIDHVVDAIAQLPPDIYNAIFNTGSPPPEKESGGFPLGVASFLRPVVSEFGGMTSRGSAPAPDVFVVPNLGGSLGPHVSDIKQSSVTPVVSQQQSAFESRILSGYYNVQNTSSRAMMDEWNRHPNPVLQGKFSQELFKVQQQENIKNPDLSVVGQRLPSDPRTLIAKRDELIARLAHITDFIRELQSLLSSSASRSSNNKTIWSAQLSSAQSQFNTVQAELTSLLQKYDFAK